ncbi:hypothetical protein KM043_001737 [Ampulex compressa]|nr:hypothetical protein KM043_001737 [Ampulex compressa]
MFPRRRYETIDESDEPLERGRFGARDSKLRSSRVELAPRPRFASISQRSPGSSDREARNENAIDPLRLSSCFEYARQREKEERRRYRGWGERGSFGGRKVGGKKGEGRLGERARRDRGGNVAGVTFKRGSRGVNVRPAEGTMNISW